MIPYFIISARPCLSSDLGKVFRNEELTIIKSYFIDIDNGIYEIEEKKER